MITNILVVVLAATFVAGEDEDTTWKPVEKSQVVEFDADTFSLQIKTDADHGSYKNTELRLKTADDEDAGAIFLNFADTLTYRFENCMGSGYDLWDAPAGAEKIWELTITTSPDVRIKITCNGEQLANSGINDQNCPLTNWADTWGKEVKKIMFLDSDSASVFYRPVCEPGNYVTESKCVECEKNTYGSGVSDSCTACPGDLVSDAGSSSVDDCKVAPCSAGNYMTESGCQQCGENTYSGDAAESCTSCPDGKLSAAGSTSEDDCGYDAPWVPVQKTEKVDLDLQSFSVQIKTNGVIGSFEQVLLDLFSADDLNAGTLLIEFGLSKIQYMVIHCTSEMSQFPVPEDIPEETEKIWQITVRKKPVVTVTIACNGVELVNLELTKDTCTNLEWATNWERDVKKIGFQSDDTASRFYRAVCQPGNFIADTECKKCGVNTYGSGVSISCTACPGGFVSYAGSSSADDCKEPCSAGYYMTESGCQQCEENTYSGDGAESCTSCPDGKLSAPGSTSEADCGYDAPWVSVQRKDKIDLDMQSYSLQIKTKSVIGSFKQVRLDLFSADDENAGRLVLEFHTKIQYWLQNCFDRWQQFPVPEDIPSETEKIWQITVRKKPVVTVTIACNGIELVNLELTKDTCTNLDWADYWGRDIKKVGFQTSDSASRQYRAVCQPGNFIADSECKKCEVNTYGSGLSSICTACSEGLVSDAGSSSADDCKLAPCSAGNYMTESGCQQCEENTYSGDGAESCTSCPDGKLSSAGSTSEADCGYAPVNGGFSEWGSWSDCSADCGLQGTQSRIRTCTNPTPAYEGSACVGVKQENQNCTTSCSGESSAKSIMNAGSILIMIIAIFML